MLRNNLIAENLLYKSTVLSDRRALRQGGCVNGNFLETAAVHIRIERNQRGGVQAGIALWAATQFSACEKARAAGLVVVCGQPIGADGYDGLIASASTIPVLALVVDPWDLPQDATYAARAAERGLIRRVFTDPKSAAVWASARAKALRLARSLPTLSPELQARRPSLSLPALQCRLAAQLSRQPKASS